MSQKLTSEFSAERNGCSDDVRSKEPANGVKNKNKPKCVNCLRYLCNAGKVNHNTHWNENGFVRTPTHYISSRIRSPRNALSRARSNRAPQ